MPYSYSIGDEPSSSNYRPGYCNKCDADTPDQYICSNNSSDRQAFRAEYLEDITEVKRELRQLRRNKVWVPREMV